MRNLKTASGATIPAPEGFRYYRDQLPADSNTIQARRAHFESLFKTSALGGDPPLRPLPGLGLHGRH